MDNKEKILKYKSLLEEEISKNDVLEQKAEIMKGEKEELLRKIQELTLEVETLKTKIRESNSRMAIIAEQFKRVFSYFQNCPLPNEAIINTNDANQNRLSFATLRTDYREFCKQYSQIYVYGAGIKAKRCAETLKKDGISFQGFVVTNKSNNATTFQQHKVMQLEEAPYNDSNVGILLALNEMNAKQVIPVLQNLGVKNVCYFI